MLARCSVKREREREREREKVVLSELFINMLLPSGLKRVFSNRRQGYNGLAWGIRILATFTNQ